MKGTIKTDILENLKNKLRSNNTPHLTRYLKEIDDAISVINFRGEASQMGKSSIGRSERKDFE